MALTGDPATAATLLGEVSVLTGLRRGPDADPDERALLVGRWLRRRRRPPASTPDEPGARTWSPRAELQAVLSRVDLLPPLERTVLVLRHREQLTLHELARLVDRTPPAAARTLERAEAAVAAAPHELVAALDALPGVPPGAVRAAADRFARERRRRRGRGVLAGAAVLVLLVATTVVPGLLEQRSRYLRPYGAWVHGFDLDAGPDWQAGARTLTAGRDSLVVHRTGDDRRCLVDQVVSRTPLTVPDGDRAMVRGRPAAIVPSRGAAAPYLWWSLDSRTAAVIGCSSPVGPQVLLDLAGRVRLRAVPARLPFGLPPLGDGLTVRYVAVGDSSLVALALPPGRVSRAAGTAYVSVPGSSRLPEDPQRRSPVTVQGVAGTLDRGRTGGLTLCWPVQQTSACVSAYVFRERADPDQARLLRELTTLAQGLAFAPSLDDGTTWFDARQALPG